MCPEMCYTAFNGHGRAAFLRQNHDQLQDLGPWGGAFWTKTETDKMSQQREFHHNIPIVSS